MVMISNEKMMATARLDKETAAEVKALAEKLHAMEYGAKLEAIKLFGFYLPDLGGHGYEYPMDTGMADAITHGVLRANLPTLHKSVMDLCLIGTGKHIDDSIINSVVVDRKKQDLFIIKVDDNRSTSKRFTIKVEADCLGVTVTVHKTGQEGQYGDLRDEGYVMAWEAAYINSTYRRFVFKEELTEEEQEQINAEEESIYRKGLEIGFIETFMEMPVEKFDIGCEDRNHYFCSEQMLFGMVLSDCWDEFKEKVKKQPELDLFDEKQA